MILNCRYHVYRIIASDISLKLDALGYISVAESIRASCHSTHGRSAIKRKLSKSAFSEGVRHFKR